MSIENQLQRCKEAFDAGDPLALHEAILWAAWNHIPVPDWAVPGLEAIVMMHSEGRFSRGKGVPAPWKASDSHARDDSMRSEVLRLMSLPEEAWRVWVGDVPQSLPYAFAEVAESYTRAFRDQPDRKVFTAAMVKAAYYREQSGSSKKGHSSGSDKP